MTILIAVYALAATCSLAYALRCFHLDHAAARQRAAHLQRMLDITRQQLADARAERDATIADLDGVIDILTEHAETQARHRHPSQRLAVVK